MVSSVASMQLYTTYVTKIIHAWTDVRICLDQSSGGPNTGQKVDSLIRELPIVVRRLKYADEVADFLEDFMYDELNAICDDDIIPQVSKMLVDGMRLVSENKLDELQTRIDKLPTGCDLSQCKAVVTAPEEIEESGSDNETSGDDDAEMDTH
ncbi:unnamed protein product [Calicophoron daubneyi]|uniref:Pre-rRNA-processing protein TSR2 homolog n=1 Tax=Calicophoron daubneyi TaxID=300641 RepID=A0AAV2TGB9_CALDB